METIASRIARALRGAGRILVVSHERPDGDSLGSALALALALERLEKAVVVGSQDGVPAMYRFLPTWERVRLTPPPEPFDVAVGVECSDPARAGVFAAALSGAPLVVNIDHHLANSGYGHLVWVEPEASAVAELMSEVIAALGVAVDEPIATCLLTGLLTDTGSFRYPSVRPQSFLLAADLVRSGARPHEIYERVYESRSVASARLLGWALSRMETAADGSLIWTVVDETMVRACGGSWEDTENIATTLRGIAGVRCAILFRLEADKVRVSLRTREGVDANEIARRFGGGGHAGAAGFVATGRPDEVIRATLAAAEEAVRSTLRI